METNTENPKDQSGGRTLTLDIVAPDKRVFQGIVTRVRAPGAQGSFEVRYNHAPMIATLDVGPIIITLPDAQKLTFATSGGFLEIIGNVGTVLAETAEPASDIDVDRARAAEERALERLQRADKALDRSRAEHALQRARNRLRIGMARVGERVST